jgi:hypothetical protein
LQIESGGSVKKRQLFSIFLCGDVFECEDKTLPRSIRYYFKKISGEHFEEIIISQNENQ